jgi:hypothetical protein
MADINLPPFYVGQRIVAIKDHSQGRFKKGDEFVVKDQKMKCCGWAVYYGDNMKFPKGTIIEWPCSHCGGKTLSKDQRVFFKSTSFVPIEQNFQSISLEKVLEKETPMISVN